MVKAMLHMRQMNGRLPVCVNHWRSRLLGQRNDLSHMVHGCGRLTVLCLMRCTRRLLEFVNVLSQSVPRQTDGNRFRVNGLDLTKLTLMTKLQVCQLDTEDRDGLATSSNYR